MSVTIVKLERKTNPKTNEQYSLLILQGEAKVEKSRTTGRPYLTACRAKIPCALEENQANALIGQSLPGSIERQECTPFEVKTPAGKKIKITSSFQYLPEK